MREKCTQPQTAQDACIELDKMMIYTIDNLVNDFSPNFDEIINQEFKAPWGQTFDIDSMLEHAVVHILRHRRQIEKFISFSNQ